MDSINNENVAKVTAECKETEKKSIESPQEKEEKAANEKIEETLLEEDAASDDEDDLANVLADLYMSGSSTVPNDQIVKEEQVLEELRSQSLPVATPPQVCEDLEETPDVDEEALIDRLLEELNHCVVGIVQEDEVPGF